MGRDRLMFIIVYENPLTKDFSLPDGAVDGKRLVPQHSSYHRLWPFKLQDRLVALPIPLECEHTIDDGCSSRASRSSLSGQSL